MSRKRRSVSHNNVVELTQALYLNGRAIQEGPRRKHWSKHDLRFIKPLTPTQGDMFQDWMNGMNIVAHGSAGTGKSYVALYLALNEYLKPESEYEHIVIVRSAVPTRQLGFMPGSLDEKVALYETPYRDILAELVGKNSTYDDMKEAGVINFMTTSFIRGLTWSNTLVVVDEAQDMTLHELNSIMTRLGENSRIMVCGDTKQNDLVHSKHDVSGLEVFLKIVATMPNISLIQFNHHDIVRSDFVKQWITAYETIA